MTWQAILLADRSVRCALRDVDVWRRMACTPASERMVTNEGLECGEWLIVRMP